MRSCLAILEFLSHISSIGRSETDVVPANVPSTSHAGPCGDSDGF